LFRSATSEVVDCASRHRPVSSVRCVVHAPSCSATPPLRESVPVTAWERPVLSPFQIHRQIPTCRGRHPSRLPSSCPCRIRMHHPFPCPDHSRKDCPSPVRQTDRRTLLQTGSSQSRRQLLGRRQQVHSPSFATH